MSDEPSLYLLTGLFVVGAALLITVRLTFARRSAHGDDSLQRGMTIAGWVLIHLGVLGAFSLLVGGWAFPLWFVWLMVSAMAVQRYRQNERRALLAVLAAAAEKGLPLEHAARAFAEERYDEIGLRSARLAAYLEQGAPLPEAMRRSRNPLPLDAHLAASVGGAVGGLGAALTSAVEFHEEFDLHLRGAIEKFLYLCWVAAMGLAVVSFLMLKIIPMFAEMFVEFDLELPPMTVLLIDVSDAAVQYWFLAAPLYYLAAMVALLAPFYYIGWLRFEPPLLRRAWRRVHTAWVLQALALTVRRRRPIAEGLHLLATNYPRTYIAARLYNAASRTAQGEPWFRALASQRLIGADDSAVLAAAERTGNLAWAMEELAESHLRRMRYRLRAAGAVLFPCAILTLAVPVFFFVVGLFLPLINLIVNLV